MRSGPISEDQRGITTEWTPAAPNLLDDLARRYYKPLLSFFRKRTRNAPEVGDLVQQVFLRLAQLPGLERMQNPDGYVFQTAANTLRDHYRRQVVREEYSREEHSRVASEGGADWDSGFSPERVLQGRQMLVQVAEAMRELPQRTRDILVLRCFEGLRHAEIAQMLGISTRAVEKHIAKALAYLSQVVEAAGKP